MVTAQSLGLVSEEVNRIRSFLLDRATAHDEENTFGDPLHRLCAATLRRDAAATSIILEDYSDAAALLRQAGHGFVAATSLYGLTLLSVTDEAPPWHLFEGRTATLEYHWPLLLSPSDVVGFDLMIVGLAAIRNDQPLEPMLEAFGDLDSPTALPLKAALKLDASIA